MCITIRALHIELVSVFEIYWSKRSAYRVLQEIYLVEQYSQASWKFGLKETKVHVHVHRSKVYFAHSGLRFGDMDCTIYHRTPVNSKLISLQKKL